MGITDFYTEEKTAVIFTGIPASGKSTFYNENFSQAYIHINLDTLNTRNKEKALLDDCIAKGLSFVVDNTNPKASDRARYIGPAKEAGYKVIGMFFKSAIAECAARNEMRSGKAKVPVAAVAAISNKLEMPKLTEGFDELYYVFIEGNKFVINKLIEEK